MSRELLAALDAAWRLRREAARLLETGEYHLDLGDRVHFRGQSFYVTSLRINDSEDGMIISLHKDLPAPPPNT